MWFYSVGGQKVTTPTVLLTTTTMCFPVGKKSFTSYAVMCGQDCCEPQARVLRPAPVLLNQRFDSGPQFSHLWMRSKTLVYDHGEAAMDIIHNVREKSGHTQIWNPQDKFTEAHITYREVWPSQIFSQRKFSPKMTNVETGWIFMGRSSSEWEGSVSSILNGFQKRSLNSFAW